MFKSTCAHIFSLSIGFLIIVGITLLAKSLSVSTHEPHVIQCFNCTYNAHYPITCINDESKNEPNCHGVCVWSISYKKNGGRFYNQFCYNHTVSIILTPECPPAHIQNSSQDGYDVKFCESCSTDFCNSIE